MMQTRWERLSSPDTFTGMVIENWVIFSLLIVAMIGVPIGMLAAVDHDRRVGMQECAETGFTEAQCKIVVDMQISAELAQSTAIIAASTVMSSAQRH